MHGYDELLNGGHACVCVVVDDDGEWHWSAKRREYLTDPWTVIGIGEAPELCEALRLARWVVGVER